jgi:hypothetical protein
VEAEVEAAVAGSPSFPPRSSSSLEKMLKLKNLNLNYNF